MPKPCLVLVSDVSLPNRLLGEAEVGELGDAGGIEQNIGRLDVPMDDALGMSMGQAVCHFPDDAQGDTGGQSAPLGE